MFYKKIILKVMDCLLKKRAEHYEIKKINEKKRKKIYRTTKIKRDDKRKILEFYKKNYGKKISLKWHRYYYSVSGKLDVNYFPEILYIPNYERLSNDFFYKKVLQDKNILDIYMKNNKLIKMPKSILKCINGVYLNNDNERISLDEAVNLIESYNRIFIKSTIDTNSGISCKLCNFENGYDKNTKESIKDIILNYRNNFIVQEVVENHPSLSQFNPSSFNTFRVITYSLNKQIFHMPLVLRMGRKESFLDNAHAGGIFIGVQDDGTVLDFAVNEYGEKFSRHPDTNIEFKGIKIPYVSKIIEYSKQIHLLFPKIGCVHWDLSIDKNNDVILIEANMSSGGIWLPQMAHGKGPFGDNLKAILNQLRNKKHIC